MTRLSSIGAARISKTRRHSNMSLLTMFLAVRSSAGFVPAFDGYPLTTRKTRG